MTLKKSLRTAQKASRAIDKAHQAEERRKKGFIGFEDRVVKRPISTLNLQYDPVDGLTSDFIDLEVPAGRIRFGPITAEPTVSIANPAERTEGGMTIRPLDMYFISWATLIPIEVSNVDQEARLKVNWVKKTDRSSSSIFLLDAENSQYYYPVETDLTGEILAGHPRSGLFAFEPFRSPTNRVELHISGIRSGSGRHAQTTSFVFELEASREAMEVELKKPGVAEFLEQHYSQNSGCSVLMLLLGSSLLAGVAGSARFLLA